MKQRLFTLLVALVAMTAGAWADDRTEISLVEGTSPDLTSIPEVGVSVKTMPTITLTKGEPARFVIDSSNSKWQKKVDGKWKYVNAGTFTPGDWRFNCQVKIDGSTDPDNQYVLAENVKIKVNGIEWETETDTYCREDHYSFIAISSPEITLEGAEDTRTKISLVECTGSDLATIAVAGASVAHPSFTVTSGAPASINQSESYWYERKLYFREFHDGTFIPGTWEYYLQVRIDDENGKTHVLDDNVKLKVNGVEWYASQGTVIDGSASYREFFSPDIIVSRNQISLIEGTASPDLTTIAVRGASVTTMPTMSVTKGTPAFFETCTGNANWQKKMDGEWKNIYKGSFTPGTWRLACQVWINYDDNKTDVLAEQVTVKVNGEEWEADPSFISSDFSVAWIYSPEIIVEEEKYDLIVCNEQVTEGNCRDILGDGAFSYDNDTKTLTVKGNATAEGSDYVIYNEGIDGLTIDVAADVTLESADRSCIYMETNTTLTGKGTLKVTSLGGCAIYANMGATLTIDGLTMEASGLWGISGRPSSESLIVREADIKVTGLNGAVCDFPGGITIEGCTIDTPAGGEVQNGNIVDKDGNVAMTVELKTPPFDLYVCNKQVTKGNCEDILGDGAFSYDNDTKTLTVTGNATAEGSDYVIYNEGIDGLTIDVAADVTLEAQKACIGLGTNTTLKGKGTLKITSTSDCAIYAYRGATLTIDGLTIEASGLWGISGRPTSESLIVRRANIKATGLNGAVCDFPSGIMLENCTIETPEGGKVQDGNIVDEDGNVSLTVELKADEVVGVGEVESERVKSEKYPSTGGLRGTFDLSGRPVNHQSANRKLVVRDGKVRSE